MTDNKWIWIIGIIVLIYVINQGDLETTEFATISLPDVSSETGIGFVSVEAMSGVDSPLVINFYVPQGNPQGGIYPQSEVLIKIDNVELLEVPKSNSISGKITINKQTSSCTVSGVSKPCLINGNSEIINQIFSKGNGNVVMIGNNYLVGSTGSEYYFGCVLKIEGQPLGTACQNAGWRDSNYGIGVQTNPAGCNLNLQAPCYNTRATYGFTGVKEPIYHSVKYFIGGDGTLTNEKIIKLTMKNTGSQQLYDIVLVKEGTTPLGLYNAFSNLNPFILEPNGQAIFFANLDISQFDGVVPFQMVFSSKYTVGDKIYGLTKFTNPLVLTFDNGELII